MFRARGDPSQATPPLARGFLKEASDSHQRPLCPKHPLLPLDHMCMTHSVIICVECVAYEHPLGGHDVRRSDAARAFLEERLAVTPCSRFLLVSLMYVLLDRTENTATILRDTNSELEKMVTAPHRLRHNMASTVILASSIAIGIQTSTGTFGNQYAS